MSPPLPLPDVCSGVGEGMANTPGSHDGWVKVWISFGISGLVFVLIPTSPTSPVIDLWLLGRRATRLTSPLCHFRQPQGRLTQQNGFSSGCDAWKRKATLSFSLLFIPLVGIASRILMRHWCSFFRSSNVASKLLRNRHSTDERNKWDFFFVCFVLNNDIWIIDIFAGVLNYQV